VAKLVARLLATKYKMGHISEGVANKHSLASSNILSMYLPVHMAENCCLMNVMLYIYMPFDDTGSQVAAYFLTI
jgi:hypothetical protein